jgi:hypothetical protein
MPEKRKTLVKHATIQSSVCDEYIMSDDNKREKNVKDTNDIIIQSSNDDITNHHIPEKRKTEDYTEDLINKRSKDQ